VIQLLPAIQLLRLSFSSYLIMLVEVVRVEEKEVVVVEEAAHYWGRSA